MSESVENRKEFGIHAPYQPGSFVHSMANFASIFKRILSGLSPRSYCEIGVEGQIMTENIIALARPNGCPIYGIDPTLETHPAYENYILIRKPSLEGLHDIPACDVYFVDGDHNYYTVKQELERIKEIPASAPMFPLLFLHDVGWPQDRRDGYYLPSHVPQERRHKANSGLGVDPTLRELSEFGLAADDPGYIFANDRGGPENGVLTAVEDFVRENPDWRYVTIPGVFGLGIVHKTAGSEDLTRRIDELGAAVSWLGELLSILEYNRLQLHCESYRHHHNYSLTIKELSDASARIADLELEVVEAYQSRDATNVVAEQVAAQNAHVEREIIEVRQSRDAANLRAEQIAARNAELERDIGEACQSREAANLRAEEIAARNAELEREIGETGKSRDAFEARAEALSAFCDSMQRSWSFRIGRMITFPGRWVKRLFK
ncbi:hypothetical protein GJ654_19885 [Rhodoblastus acidophilus]|uniref:Methyltransferase domain-containing protein n=1 Tax=Rhodoblastus acidophilus TaxID=1074 RepID=A0A6N8DVS2_RHOAC|nr:hypothetical protein [Rhodoblastus acidophilus]MCW2276465.1 FtsZ-binding cell division protein ZapB [Rhodoblastus acidophilus]MTV33241.1 hypothetical protein [Rhodoblastus acidophilus]